MTKLEIARKEYQDQIAKMARIREHGGTATDKDFAVLRQKWSALETVGAHLSPLD